MAGVVGGIGVGLTGADNGDWNTPTSGVVVAKVIGADTDCIGTGDTEDCNVSGASAVCLIPLKEKSETAARPNMTIRPTPPPIMLNNRFIVNNSPYGKT